MLRIEPFRLDPTGFNRFRGALMTEDELTAKSSAIFRQACAAFERRDMIEHERLRLAHKELLEQYRLQQERVGRSVH